MASRRVKVLDFGLGFDKILLSCGESMLCHRVAWLNAGLLIKSMPKNVVFSFLDVKPCPSRCTSGQRSSNWRLTTHCNGLGCFARSSCDCNRLCQTLHSCCLYSTVGACLSGQRCSDCSHARCRTEEQLQQAVSIGSCVFTLLLSSHFIPETAKASHSMAQNNTAQRSVSQHTAQLMIGHDLKTK